ncbi:serine hydrolase [Tissierella sp.]|uniref:serine hydrolase n=1 Tax=Tissierella sp. TaxID=41274 RepID=UPI002865344B|nr:serine hydrolase [Tissierella sp.]MDR7855393.1 serine hydrolase [Tissierella sp.]
MIKDIILEEVNSANQKVSIVIKDLTHNQWILKYDENRVFPSASIIKILIMVEALNQVEKGKFSLDQKIKIKEEDRVDYSIISDLRLGEYSFVDLITLMIILSDNTATNVLIDLIGYENINQRAKELNLKDTVLKRKMMDFKAAKEGRENLISSIDMAILMEKIYNKNILSSKMCETMIEILSKQKHRDMLPRYILDKETIAHKTGELSGLNHDIGIFYLENIDYLIGIFTTDGKNDLDGKRTIGRISKLVYDYFLEGKNK